jgi:hypothetical protein
MHLSSFVTLALVVAAHGLPMALMTDGKHLACVIDGGVE